MASLALDFGGQTASIALIDSALAHHLKNLRVKLHFASAL